jgi:hypothetical protein
MAEKRIRRIITAIFDRKAADQVESEMVRSLESAGKKGGDNFLRELRGSFNKQMASLREDLAAGVIDEKEFKRKADEAARAFNEGMLASIKKAREEGRLTDAEYVKLTKQLKRTGDQGATTWDRIRAGILKAGAALAGMFAIRQLWAFGRESLRMAEAIEQGQRALEQQLINVGVAWGNVRGEVQQTTRALWDTHRLTAGEVTQILRQLIVVTGDYETSLRAVGTVQDIAAATGLGVEQSARLLGRALEGDINVFRRYGLQIDATRDVLEQLDARFKGAALAGTTGAQTLRKAWGDFKEEFGRVLMEVGRGPSIMDRLTTAVRWATDNLEVMLTGLINLGSVVTRTAALLRGTFQVAVAGVVQSLGWMVDGAAAAIRGISRLNDLIGRDTAADRWGQYADQIQATADRLKDFAKHAANVAEGNFGRAFGPGAASATNGTPTGAGGSVGPLRINPEPTPAEKHAAEERVKNLWAHLERWTHSQQAYDAVTGMARPGPRAPAITGRIEQDRREVDPAITAAFRMESEIQQMMPRITSYAADAAYEMSRAWQDAFAQMMQDGANLGSFMEALGRGMAGGLLAGLSQLAQSKAAENFVWAIEAGAKALLMKDPAAAASVPKFLAAGAGWSALSGMAGAGRGAVTGGGGAIPSPVRDAGLGTARRSERMGGEIHIQVDGIDPLNPRHQNLLHHTAKSAGERYGGTVFVNGRRR